MRIMDRCAICETPVIGKTWTAYRTYPVCGTCIIDPYFLAQHAVDVEMNPERLVYLIVQMNPDLETAFREQSPEKAKIMYSQYEMKRMQPVDALL